MSHDINIKLIRHILSMLVTVVLIVTFFGCDELPITSENDGSTIIESQPDSTSKKEYTSTEAYEALYAALDNDRKLTELFICCSAFSNDQVNAAVPDEFTQYKLKPDCEFYRSDAVSELMYSTYCDDSPTPSAFTSYPSYGPPSVSLDEEFTLVTRHSARDFDYPDNNEFRLKRLSSERAEFEFDYNGQTKTITITLSDRRLSEGVYSAVSDPYEGDWADNPKLDAFQNSGSASKLQGNVFVINMFLDDGASGWDADERETVINNVQEALRALEQTAANRGVTLKFTSTDMTNSLLYRHKDKIDPEPGDHMWLNSLLAHTTYGTIEDYIGDFFDVSQYDSYCLMVHLNKNGVTESAVCKSDAFDSSLYETERAVMMLTEYELPTPADYAREILTMFGAVRLDEYEAARVYFPTDLMCGGNDLSKDPVGNFTAFRVGWLNDCDGFLDVFLPLE